MSIPTLAVQMIREAVAIVERGDAKTQLVASAIATIKVEMTGFWNRRIVVTITPATQLGWARIESSDFGDTKIADLVVAALDELGRRRSA